ncbi:hypothetical protein [Larsenimonas rhizosphaerae]|uniref:hypothetical protein n=1 Tax=Larsenimonas rhizosphaerae TaxID=2944682 RepID=UPI00203365ED|nr:hypothetical protein [Larsenimonas rhizosphaerae]MCM2132199.1 hypothetical protein [Larsenimonas rhizosphaerae]
MLNENATLFRRRYLNGSHAGFVMYVSDAAQNQEDIDAMREAFKTAKGVGNFRSLFLHSPNGKKDGVQITLIMRSRRKTSSPASNITRVFVANELDPLQSVFLEINDNIGGKWSGSGRMSWAGISSRPTLDRD